jgi:NADH-quinone oxidoreductase subunit N
LPVASPLGAAELAAGLPILVVAIAAVAVMLLIALRRHHGLTAGMTAAGLALALILLPIVGPAAPRRITSLLTVDPYALFYSGLMLATSLGVTILSYGYFAQRRGQREELYLLLLLATLGALVLVASTHFVSFVIGLELLSVSLFGLIAYSVTAEESIEAGVKYLVLAGMASALLLFGMALVYAGTGSMDLLRLAEMLSAPGRTVADAYVLGGIVLIIAGVGFKLSLVPFHMWAPDIYQGAPAPITAFIATVSKGATFALLLRYFYQADLYRYPVLTLFLSAIAAASILVGNLLALRQQNLKRLLAYSSIAHMGYALVAFLAGGRFAVEAVTYYLLAYFVMNLGAFGVIAILSPPDSMRDLDRTEDYRGLFWRRPWLAGALSGMLLALAGVPLTVGFVAKFYALAAGVAASLWVLAVILVIGSVIGLYYYLRVIVVMFRPLPQAVDPGIAAVPSRLQFGQSALMAVLSVMLVWLGVYPAPVIALIQSTGL